MRHLARLTASLRYVPSHRVVPGNPSLPPALCAMSYGSAPTGFRYVTLCRLPTSPERLPAISHRPQNASRSPNLTDWPTPKQEPTSNISRA